MEKKERKTDTKTTGFLPAGDALPSFVESLEPTTFVFLYDGFECDSQNEDPVPEGGEAVTHGKPPRHADRNHRTEHDEDEGLKS
jgi:hypothetical protein